MIKADIVKRLSDGLSNDNQPLKEKDALVVVDQIIEAIKEIIIKNERLEIRDFGVFQIKERKARMGRNPKNKKEYPIPPHRVVTFKAGKEIKNLQKVTPDLDTLDEEV